MRNLPGVSWIQHVLRVFHVQTAFVPTILPIVVYDAFVHLLFARVWSGAYGRAVHRSSVVYGADLPGVGYVETTVGRVRPRSDNTHCLRGETIQLVIQY